MTRVLLLAVLLASAVPVEAQGLDPVDVLLGRLDGALNSQSREAFAALFAMPQADVDRSADDLFISGAVRTVLRERDRAPLEGVPEGDGFQLVVEFFIESPGRARIVTSGLSIRRPAGGDIDTWRIVATEGVSSVDGLYRLRLNVTQPLAARNVEITSEDLTLTLQEGTVFPVESDDGITGLVLVGRGEMRFAPAPAAEKGQLQIFSGSETLVASFETAFIRMNPSDYRKRLDVDALMPAPPDGRLARRAEEVFRRESTKSFSLDLQDLSRDAWHLLPSAGDFLAEVNTQRHDTLTYLMSSAQAEDISLFQRRQRRTISLYASIAKLAARGRFYTDDALREYDVIDYNIEATVIPDRQLIQGRARLSIRVRSRSLSTLMLRLAEPLAVTGVTSVEYGRLLHLRVRNQNTILINLPRVMPQDADVTLIVSYIGRLAPQDLDIDTMQVASDRQDIDQMRLQTEPSYLLSNTSLWYPQNPVSDYATATLRITVPEGYGCVASGQPVTGDDVVTLRDLLTLPNGKTFLFRANHPLRYFAFVISRFVRVASGTLTVEGDSDVGQVALAVEANPRQQGRGREVGRAMEDILRFYASLMNDAPFTSATIALLESDRPGGHAPGYFAVVNEPLPHSNVTWRRDPASFEGFPDFFLAHELAHQWWGQAVGWKNYHEQWISEGFSQYFAALYAQHTRGDRVFGDMLRQFRRWSLSDSDKGPIHLGYRLGHIKSDLRVYRALVYNKGAAVLHMLRRLLGDETFFNALQRFYNDRKYQKAGTDDVQRAFELESGRDLDRFFERWIYGTGIPRIQYGWAADGDTVTLRFTQLGDRVYDLPVTVTLAYNDGRSQEVIVKLENQITEQAIPIGGTVRQVQVNRDSAALAEFDHVR